MAAIKTNNSHATSFTTLFLPNNTTMKNDKIRALGCLSMFKGNIRRHGKKQKKRNEKSKKEVNLLLIY